MNTPTLANLNGVRNNNSERINNISYDKQLELENKGYKINSYVNSNNGYMTISKKAWWE